VKLSASLHGTPGSATAHQTSWYGPARFETRLERRARHHRSMSTPRALTIIGALLSTALVAACGAQSGVPTTARSHVGSGSATSTAGPGSTGSSSTIPTPVIVRKPLTDAQRQAMLVWMTNWRSCMAGQDVSLPAPVIHPRDISIDVSAVAGYLKPNQPLPTVPSSFQQTSMSCIAKLGGPPATFLRTAGIVDIFHGTCAVSGHTTAGKQ
jgi:hypothetical protein